jgi:hypothetical protein
VILHSNQRCESVFVGQGEFQRDVGLKLGWTFVLAIRSVAPLADGIGSGGGQEQDNTMEPVKVSLGITDHAYTEVSAVLKGELNEGDDVIIRSVAPKPSALGGIRR